MVDFVRTTSLVWDTIDKTKYNESIVFIEDTCQIYSNGVYYCCSPEIIGAILELITDVKDITERTELKLDECLTTLSNKIDNIAQAKAYYDSNIGNLTLENIELTIE